MMTLVVIIIVVVMIRIREQEGLKVAGGQKAVSINLADWCRG